MSELGSEWIWVNFIIVGFVLRKIYIGSGGSWVVVLVFILFYLYIYYSFCFVVRDFRVGLEYVLKIGNILFLLIGLILF